MLRLRTRAFPAASLPGLVLFGLSVLGMSTTAFSQGGATLSGQTNAGRIPVPAVPFLNFTPDARSAALGEAGVALTPIGANSLFWNPSQLVFLKEDAGVSLSYTPWLRALGLDDMYLGYLAGYKKLGKDQVIGLSVNYFDQGRIEFTNNVGTSLGNYYSKEYAVAASYSRRLFSNFSLGLNLRYINSNLVGNQVINGTALKPGTTVAGDIGAFYRGDPERNTSFNFGLLLSNLGGNVNYGGTGRYPIPTNLKLGTAMTSRLGEFHKLTLTLDLNKLMVPTPPEYDNAGQIVRGKLPSSTLGGVFGSFADAPDGFGEELKEWTQSVGAEYWYNDVFAARVGYFNESVMKGNRKYFTAGVGFHYSNIGFDFAYLFPQSQSASNALAQTLRLTLSINFAKGSRVAEPDEEDTEN